MLGLPPDDSTLRDMVRRYEDLLPQTLPLRQGHVMPHVREILDDVSARTDVRSYLLTGNTRGGARAKLTYYDLFKYFPDGAFAEDLGDRPSIAARAVELARRAGPLQDERLFVIGDTPHDVHAANAIGARTIAVATGGYSIEELEAHNPWRTLPELPDPRAFDALLDQE